jgi:alpha-N-arabinofuranosidase
MNQYESYFLSSASKEVRSTTVKHHFLSYLICFVLCAACAASDANSKLKSARAIPLVNAGFEAAAQHEGWSVHVYGAQPEVSLDAAVRHEGRQSLKIHAEQPSDTALGQEIQLQPGHWYRLSGWVRCENLDPQSASVCGTFQIQNPGGNGTLVSGRSHPGTSDWTRETLYFTPPNDGKTRIAIFFAGYGKGTGTAWFDDISLEEINDLDSTIQITRTPICPGTISPFQNGQFIEYLCALTLSMSAEQVFDNSFEGVPPYKFAFRKETDRYEKPWYPEGAVHRGQYSLDTDNPYNGKQSQRITASPGDPCTLGIAQAGKYVRRGMPMKCSLSLRMQGVSQLVEIALSGEGKTYATAELHPSETWQRFTAELTPSETDHDAVLSISFKGPGTLWIDQVSLLPNDHIYGWRRDVAESLKALKPGIIRFGGSTIEGFDWKDTIGDPSKRVPFTTVWGGLEPGNEGLEEFLQLCKWVEAEPLICIRYTGKTPKDAADQVEYFNGPADSPMGKLRAQNGHAEPYHVKYWQVGNELGDADYYKGLAEFCKAMKKVDPSIKLMAAFPSPELVAAAGSEIDYICPHHYDIQNMPGTADNVKWCRRIIAEKAPGRDIRMGVTEWNTTAGEVGLPRAMLWTLDNALWCARYQNLMQRNCDIMEIANRSNFSDSFCSGIIQPNNHALFKTPTYYVQELYGNHVGRTPLTIKFEADIQEDPAVDMSATLAADGKTLAIFAVNHSATTQKRTLDLSAFAPQGKLSEVYTVKDTAKSPERHAANSWREPERIRTIRSQAKLSGEKLPYEFPPYSFTLLEIH